jgi:hypothetical protein
VTADIPGPSPRLAGSTLPKTSPLPVLLMHPKTLAARRSICPHGNARDDTLRWSTLSRPDRDSSYSCPKKMQRSPSSWRAFGHRGRRGRGRVRSLSRTVWKATSLLRSICRGMWKSVCRLPLHCGKWCSCALEGWLGGAARDGGMQGGSQQCRSTDVQPLTVPTSRAALSAPCM